MRGRGCDPSDPCRGFLAACPQHSPMAGVGSKAAPPAFVLVSRHQGVLPGNSSLRNTTVLASEETKDTISVARGKTKQKQQQSPLQVVLK